jgi:hypothetical protein
MNVKASALALGLIFLAGCSSKSGGDIEELRKAPASLSEVSELLHGGGPRGGPANQLSDLDKNKHLFPRGYQAVKNGDIIILWGVRPMGEGDVAKGASQEIVAYEKKVPTEGGYVLFSGGMMKRMTADEFKAAPKAGKPSS